MDIQKARLLRIDGVVDTTIAPLIHSLLDQVPPRSLGYHLINILPGFPFVVDDGRVRKARRGFGLRCVVAFGAHSGRFGRER